MSDLQPLLAQVKEYRGRGKLLPFEEFLVREDPEGFELFERSALRQGALDTKTREIIMAALDAAVRVRSRHMQRALAAGATKAELVDMLQIVAFISGAATISDSFDALIEDLDLVESSDVNPAVDS